MTDTVLGKEVGISRTSSSNTIGGQSPSVGISAIPYSHS
jgi:hypothetical protein